MIKNVGIKTDKANRIRVRGEMIIGDLEGLVADLGNGLFVVTKEAAGELTKRAGDMHVVAENFYLGAETVFATTEPTSCMIFKAGTAPEGTIGTSSALFASTTVLRKIIAASTVSNVA